MPIDEMTHTRARRALHDARARIYDPNVTLIDFGQGQVGGKTVEAKLAIRFHVRRKLNPAALGCAVLEGRTRRIPKWIGDFQTDVIEGTFRPDRHTSSVSEEGHEARGTFGGFVLDRATGERMLLSNWSVLASDWSARVGQRMFLPGRFEGGRHLVPDELGLGAVRGVGQAELGMEVAKSGRRTGIAYGVVRGVEGIARISDGSEERVIQDVVAIESRTPAHEVGASGDWGSWWLDPATMRAIGPHFAGSDSPERALAVAMPSELDSLRVDIVVRYRGVGTVLRREAIRV
jgi:endonuclease G